MYFFRDSLIDHLYQVNGRQRQEINRFLIEHQQIIADLRSRVLELESILSSKVSLLRTVLIIAFCFINLYRTNILEQ